MDNNLPNGQSGNSDTRQTPRFSAAQWERNIAEEFLAWRVTSGVGSQLMRTFAQAITQTIYRDGRQLAESGELASKLHPVLKRCNHLTFDDTVEALAYSGLHLLDRYGRVNQILEYLISKGYLPLRIKGARVLEVGAGPAPALYATRDFYATLTCWPGLGDVQVSPLATFDTIDRGPAWNIFLHHLSESLIGVRDSVLEDGALAFGLSIDNFTSFDVKDRHHRSVAARAAQIVREFNEADEWISDATARRIAYQQGVAKPSAYDMVFLCNFLTQESMMEQFELELQRLAYSLTPGGLLIVMGGTGSGYPALYGKVKEIASSANLRDISPEKAFQSNEGADQLSIVANHVRANVEFAIMNCPLAIRSTVIESLRRHRDLLDKSVKFELPKFQALIFARQGSSCKRKPGYQKKNLY